MLRLLLSKDKRGSSEMSLQFLSLFLNMTFRRRSRLFLATEKFSVKKHFSGAMRHYASLGVNRFMDNVVKWPNIL